jgi:glycine/D-amino acid oxidase-like deaminating enzyme/nitrite reductase/ring-hydroxylating ferredoxin subunit
MTSLPGEAESCWIANAPESHYPSYEDSDHADVAVVGGGIVGLTAAYLLANSGLAVTVLEARRIGRGVTGRSTAKVTCQHTLIYAYLARALGIDKARLYAQANLAGVATIIHLADTLPIECDLERKSAYVYAVRNEGRAALEREAVVARRFGIEADVLDRAPLPFATTAALVFENQAQFNPTKYLLGLAGAVRASGGRIFENTRVGGIKRERNGWRCNVGRHRLHARSVISATNLPIGTPINFDQLTQPRCHIAIACRAPAGTIDGMFIAADAPSHSLRMGRDADGSLLIVLGPKFPTGHEGNVARRFEELVQWVRVNIPAAGKVAWRWVNEDYDAPGRVPFAGQLERKAPGLYVATGFGGWGISNGTAAAMLIADQIRGTSNPWSPVYAPERRVRKINKGGDSRSIVRSLDAIPVGEGAVIKDGKRKIAVWKSPAGKPYALDAACTHMGCTVTWNNADHTWDCPCHGSMFTCKGDVIHGPATEPMKKVPLRAAK